MATPANSSLNRTIGVQDLKFSEIDSAFNNTIKGKGSITEIRASGMLMAALDLDRSQLEGFTIDSDLITASNHTKIIPSVADIAPDTFGSRIAFQTSLTDIYLGLSPNTDLEYWMDSAADDGNPHGDLDGNGAVQVADITLWNKMYNDGTSITSTSDNEGWHRFLKLITGNGSKVSLPGLNPFKVSVFKGNNLHYNTIVKNPVPSIASGYNQEFGYAAAVGSYNGNPYFVIGDPDNWEGGTSAPPHGSVFTFNASGAHLSTIPHPSPINGYGFMGEFLAADSDYWCSGVKGYNSNQGRVYVYTITTSTLQRSFTGGATGDLFGAGVAMDQDIVYIAAPGANSGTYGSGTLYAYNYRTGASLWSVNYPDRNTNLYSGINHQWGNRIENWKCLAAGSGYVAISGGWNGSNGGKGTVWVYNTAGTLQYSIDASDAGLSHANGNNFGAELLIYKDYLVCSHFDDGLGDNYACIFTLSTGAFQRKIQNPDTDRADTNGDRFSSSLAAGDDKLFIGAPLDEEEDRTSNLYTGSVYTYDFDGNLLHTFVKDDINLANADAGAADLGYSLAANDKLAVFGAPTFDSDATSPTDGIAVLFDPRFIDKV